MFRFTSNAGKIGIDHTTWRAIIAALGPAKANSLPNLYDIPWTYTTDEAIDRDVFRRGPVLTYTGAALGMMEEIRG